MASNQTKEFKKKYIESQNKDFKIAWDHLNWEWRGILILGFIALMYLAYKFSQWLVG